MTPRMEADPLLGELLSLLATMEVGARVPSERELAATLGSSRTALRDRLGSLESLGVLKRRIGSGTYVQALTPDTVSRVLTLGFRGSGLTLTSLQSLRIGLERQAAREASGGHAAGPIAVMAVAVKRMDDTEDPEIFYDADIQFHRALFEAAESPALIFFADVLHEVIVHSVEMRTKRMRQVAHSAELMRQLHREIYEAVLSGDGKRAMASIDTHFEALADIDVSDEK